MFKLRSCVNKDLFGNDESIVRTFFPNLISQTFHMQTLFMKTILSWFIVDQQFGEAEKEPCIHLKLLNLVWIAENSI